MSVAHPTYLASSVGGTNGTFVADWERDPAEPGLRERGAPNFKGGPTLPALPETTMEHLTSVRPEPRVTSR
eukprot:3437501-Prymnesium_polylepis.1